MNKKSSVSIGIGLSTMMMIFTVLCLTIFATLSYLQAERNLKEVNSIVDSSVEYYNADYKASTIYTYLLEHLDEDISEYCDENKITVEDNTYTYSISISNTKKIEVILKKDSKDLKIDSWKELVTVNGDYDYEGFVH